MLTTPESDSTDGTRSYLPYRFEISAREIAAERDGNFNGNPAH